MRLKNIYYGLVSSFLIITILIYGKAFLIPLILSIILWIFIHQIKLTIKKIPVLKLLPEWANTLLSSTLFIFLIVIFVSTLNANIKQLIISSKTHQASLNKLIDYTNQFLSVDIKIYFIEHIKDINFSNIFNTIFNSITNLISNMFLVIIYTIFLFVEETFFEKKLISAVKDKKDYNRISKILMKIEFSVKKYLGLKTLTSFFTGFISYFIFLFIGIDSPLFWAFLIFFFNYIPTLGSILATIFPAVYAFIQFGSFYEGLLIILLISIIQIIIGNIIEPKLVGNSMNISPLVAILSLSFWGSIWGITGMILSIPTTIIIIIILSQFNTTKGIANMLAEKGIVEE